MAIFVTILCVLIALLAGLAIGYIYRKNIQEKKIGRTEEYARNLLDDAQRRAEEKKKESILEAKEEVINLSVAQSLPRTLNTTITTLLTIVTLYVLGVDSIKQFALPLIIGIVAGTYSANMINGYVWALLMDKRVKK